MLPNMTSVLVVLRVDSASLQDGKSQKKCTEVNQNTWAGMTA
jgi:hypothetical protein